MNECEAQITRDAHPPWTLAELVDGHEFFLDGCPSGECTGLSRLLLTASVAVSANFILRLPLPGSSRPSSDGVDSTIDRFAAAEQPLDA